MSNASQSATTCDSPFTSALRRIAAELRDEPRQGADSDVPEGARFIQISDTAAKALEAELLDVAQTYDPFKLSDDSLHRYGNAIAVEIRRRMQKRDTQRVTLR